MPLRQSASRDDARQLIDSQFAPDFYDVPLFVIPEKGDVAMFDLPDGLVRVDYDVAPFQGRTVLCVVWEVWSGLRTLRLRLVAQATPDGYTLLSENPETMRQEVLAVVDVDGFQPRRPDYATMTLRQLASSPN